MSTTPETRPVPAFHGQADKLKAVMAKYGVTPAQVVAPVPEVTGKLNFDQLCVVKTAVTDPATGQSIDCEAHSGPLMYLKAVAYDPDNVQDFKTRYAGYAGFFVYTIFHPEKGECVVTHGIPIGDDGTAEPTAVSEHLSTLDQGNLFQVGLFRTSRGNRLFRCIPVQDISA